MRYFFNHFLHHDLITLPSMKLEELFEVGV